MALDDLPKLNAISDHRVRAVWLCLRTAQVRVQNALGYQLSDEVVAELRHLHLDLMEALSHIERKCSPEPTTPKVEE